jgi:hypothetical protein
MVVTMGLMELLLALIGIWANPATFGITPGAKGRIRRVVNG